MTPLLNIYLWTFGIGLTWPPFHNLGNINFKIELLMILGKMTGHISSRAFLSILSFLEVSGVEVP